MKMINLTPHNVNIIVGETELVIPASGVVARCASTTETVGEIVVNGFHVPETRTVLGEVYNLPEEKPDTLYLVSRAVAEAVAKANPDRKDLRIPDKSVRNDKGQIIGCLSVGMV